MPDLTIESEAEKWIRSNPKAFCQTEDQYLLQQVLNDYDQQTSDFFRWTIDLTQAEIQDLIFQRTGKNIGQILRFIPLKRGSSGRISKLRIEGTLGALVAGKELTIRRLLSQTHLYSSAFIVEPHQVDKITGIPEFFRLHGAGWGHGVGLCQIGAAVMAEQGYTYTDILKHYFKGSQLTLLSEPS